jgi:DNA-binding transcriptional MerR regulator
MDGKRIGEIAKELGMRPGRLRYYEALRLLPTPKRSAAGYRLYDGDARQRLVFITNAKSLGLTLREIRQIIAARSGSRFPCDAVRAMLSDHVRAIDQHIARLQALKTDLQAVLRSSGARARHREGREPAVCPMIEAAPADRRTLTNGGVVR